MTSLLSLVLGVWCGVCHCFVKAPNDERCKNKIKENCLEDRCWFNTFYLRLVLRRQALSFGRCGLCRLRCQEGVHHGPVEGRSIN